MNVWDFEGFSFSRQPYHMNSQAFTQRTSYGVFTDCLQQLVYLLDWSLAEGKKQLQIVNALEALLYIIERC